MFQEKKKKKVKIQPLLCCCFLTFGLCVMRKEKRNFPRGSSRAGGSI